MSPIRSDVQTVGRCPHRPRTQLPKRVQGVWAGGGGLRTARVFGRMPYKNNEGPHQKECLHSQVPRNLTKHLLYRLGSGLHSGNAVKLLQSQPQLPLVPAAPPLAWRIRLKLKAAKQLRWSPLASAWPPLLRSGQSPEASRIPTPLLQCTTLV